MQNVLYYFIAVSVIGAVVCIYDKLAAARGWKRVPERTLFFWALVGGGPGVFACMLLIRHKTLHRIFMLGIPAVMVLQAVPAGAARGERTALRGRRRAPAARRTAACHAPRAPASPAPYTSAGASP